MVLALTNLTGKIKSLVETLPRDGAVLDVIKLVAALFMVIDHLGAAAFIPEIYRLYFGRVVFPIFSYVMACHLIKGKNSVLSYSKKLLFFAILSQPITYILVGWGEFPPFPTLNVLFTLLVSLLLGNFLLKPERHSFVLHFTLTVFVIISVWEIPLEYGISGIMLPVAFAMILKKNLSGYFYSLAALFTLNVNDIMIYDYKWWLGNGLVVIVIGIVFVLIMLISQDWVKTFHMKKRFLPRYFFYIFYPLHQAIIILIVTMVYKLS